MTMTPWHQAAIRERDARLQVQQRLRVLIAVSFFVLLAMGTLFGLAVIHGRVP